MPLGHVLSLIVRTLYDVTTPKVQLGGSAAVQHRGGSAGGAQPCGQHASQGGRAAAGMLTLTLTLRKTLTLTLTQS